MKQLSKRLTYANVMSSIAVFLVIGGGAAFAALGRNSVGARQLKKNAVNTAKLKKNAVTTAKIRIAAVTGAKLADNAVTTDKIAGGSVTTDKTADGAVTGAKIAANAVSGGKIADGSVTGADINAESTPFGRVVARLRGNSSLALKEEFQVYGLSPSSYTQAPNEVDSYYGAVDVTFQPSCTVPREAVAFLLVDPTNPTEIEPIESLVGLGATEDKAGGTVSKRIEISPLAFEGIAGSRFEPGSSKSHAVNVVVKGKCNSGSGVDVTFGGVDVTGIR